jgi:hypothetical protein
VVDFNFALLFFSRSREALPSLGEGAALLTEKRKKGEMPKILNSRNDPALVC